MMMKPFLISMLALACITYSCSRDKGLDPALQAKDACDTVRYNALIKPVIDTRCATPGCHDAGSPNGDFTNYAGVKAKVDNNTFKTRVIDQANMPQNTPLGADTLNRIKCWLSKGAPNN